MALARMSNTMLDNSGESVYPCTTLDILVKNLPAFDCSEGC